MTRALKKFKFSALKTAGFLFFSAALAFSSSICSSQQLYNLSLEELLQIKVTTVSKKSESVIDTPAPVRVLTQADIKTLGFTSLSETLNYFTGVSSVNGEGNIFTSYTIRGNTLVNFNTNTLLLLDGQPIRSPYHGSFELASFSLINIERVEMIPGAQSVFYGTNAINAVINVITKTSGYPNGETRLRTGSNGDYMLAARQTVKAFSGWANVAIETRGQDGENQLLADEAGNQVFLEDELDVASASLGWHNENWKLSFNQYEKQLPNYRSRSFSTLQENDETQWLARLENKSRWSFGEITTNLSYQDWQLSKRFFPVNTDPAYDWDYSSSLADLLVEQNLQPSEKHRGVLGVNINRSKARRYKEDSDAYDIGLFSEPTIDMALYWNADYALGDTSKLFYGSRYYSSKFKDKLKNETINFSNLSHRLGWVKKLSKKRSLKLLYAEAFRVPTYFEKQVSSEAVLGNTDLEPETSRSFDMVWSWLSKNWQLEVNPFFMQIDKKITRVDLDVPEYDPDFGKRQNQNIGHLDLYGLEANARFSYENQLSGFIGLGLYKGKNETHSSDLNFTYQTMLHGFAEMELDYNWSLTGSFKLLSDWGQAESYTLVNAGAIYLLPWKTTSRLEMRIENLFEEDVRLPEIGRETPEVPTIPETSERRFYIGISFNY